MGAGVLVGLAEAAPRVAEGEALVKTPSGAVCSSAMRPRTEWRGKAVGPRFRSARDGGFLERIAEFLDGRKYTLDGIEGVVRARESIRGSYYGGGTEVRIYHEATPKGRKSEAYRQLRQQLHDDWSTELTHSERLIEIAEKLGFRD